jgi:hypothetical protein
MHKEKEVLVAKANQRPHVQFLDKATHFLGWWEVGCWWRAGGPRLQEHSHSHQSPYNSDLRYGRYGRCETSGQETGGRCSGGVAIYDTYKGSSNVTAFGTHTMVLVRQVVS